jgi:DNA modification methylase
MCGSATSPRDVERALAGREPKLMVTDPPYGVNYDPRWRATWSAKRNVGRVANDDRAGWRAAWELFAGDVAYVWHSSLHAAVVMHDFKQIGFELRSQIIWSKRNAVFSRGHYHWQHEACFYFVRRGRTARWSGDRRQNTLWPIAPERDRSHSTQKPVACMARAIANHGAAGDDVYDPFAGSGTTIIAAEELERRCVSIEILPRNCRIAIDRWEALTGKRARLEA